MPTIIPLMVLALVATSYASPLEKLPDLNIEDLPKIDDAGSDFPIPDPFANPIDSKNTDPKDIDWENFTQGPIGGMPPGLRWCPGGIKKLCPISKATTDPPQSQPTPSAQCDQQGEVEMCCSCPLYLPGQQFAKQESQECTTSSECPSEYDLCCPGRRTQKTYCTRPLCARKTTPGRC